jgi:hypothetical protein
MRAQPVTGRDGEDHAARQFFVKGNFNEDIS